MRFAISMLTIWAIASVAGTVLKQNEPYQNYVFQFGQFWFSVFKSLGLFDVYHASWYLLILVFVVLSTSLCIFRNGPLMLREMRSFREHAMESSLRHFSHQASYSTPLSSAAVIERLTGYLGAHDYRFKQNAVAGDAGQDTLLAAKAGSTHRLGYILTHSAIVIICIGGLIDGNVPLKLEEAWGYKKIETRDIPQSQVPAVSRLTPANLSFRGSVTIPEGSSADVVFLNVGDGYMVQDLPFTIVLKKFYIEHYSTGQPKSFASDLEIVDKQTGKSFQHTITVNHPLIYKGVAIYQASFGDGGTRLSLNGWDLLSANAAPRLLDGVINRSTRLSNGNADYSIEFTDFRPLNVENFANANDIKQPGRNTMSVFGSGAAGADRQKNLRNVGPSFQYKLRDAQGQAREYNNYMLPVEIDKRWYLMTGMRVNPNEPFRFMRFPLDDQSRIEGFMQLRAVLFDKEAYVEIGQRFANVALQGDAVGETLRAKLAQSTQMVLGMFAKGGYDALAQFIEQKIPTAEQEKAAQTYLKILEAAAFEAYQLARSRAGKAPIAVDENSLQFVRDSLNTISDIYFYDAPVYLQLTQYNEVKASGLQLTRSPGKNIVYGGSVLLVLGVFAMFFIRERRIWLLLKPHSGEVLFAMSGNRKTIDFEHEFSKHKQQIATLLER